MPARTRRTRASCAGALVRPSRSVNWISWRAPRPGRTARRGPCRRSRSGRSCGCRCASHSIRPWPLTAAVDQCDDADGERGQRLGLEARREAKLGDVEHGVAGTGVEIVLDRRQRDPGAARRMGERAGGADAVVDQGEPEILAASGVKRTGSCRSAIVSRPSSARSPPGIRHVPLPSLTSKGTLARSPERPAKLPPAPRGPKRPLSAATSSRLTAVAGPSRTASARRGEAGRDRSAAGPTASAIGDAAEPAGDARRAQLRARSARRRSGPGRPGRAAAATARAAGTGIAASGSRH